MLDEPGRASSVLPRGDGPADVAREPSLAQESGNAGNLRSTDLTAHLSGRMRLSELEHCSFCGRFAGHIFRLLDVKFGVIRPSAREVGALAVGLNISLGQAEMLAPHPNESIGISEDPELVTRLFCCHACLVKPINITMAIERVTAARKSAHVAQAVERVVAPWKDPNLTPEVKGASPAAPAAGGQFPSAADLDAVAEEQKIAEQTSGEQKATQGGQ